MSTASGYYAGMTNTLPTVEQLAETIKADVLGLIAAGELPADVATFADVAEAVDANALGDTEQVWGDLSDGGGEARVQAACDFVTAARAIVEAWLKAGR